MIILTKLTIIKFIRNVVSLPKIPGLPWPYQAITETKKLRSLNNLPKSSRSNHKYMQNSNSTLENFTFLSLENTLITGYFSIAEYVNNLCQCPTIDPIILDQLKQLLNLVLQSKRLDIAQINKLSFKACQQFLQEEINSVYQIMLYLVLKYVYLGQNSEGS